MVDRRLASNPPPSPEIPVDESDSRLNKTKIRSPELKPPSRLFCLPALPAVKTANAKAEAKRPTNAKMAVVKKRTHDEEGRNAKNSPATSVELIEGSVSLPRADYLRLGVLKQYLRTSGCVVQRNDVMRAGLLALSELSDKDLAKFVSQVLKPKVSKHNE